MTVCPRCTPRVPVGAAFCPACGRAATGAHQTQSSTGSPPPAQRAWAWLLGSFGVAGLALAIAFLAFTLTRGITGPCEGLTCPLPRVGPGPHGTDPYVSETHGYRLDAASARCPDDMQVRERGPAAIDWTVADDDGGGAWPVRVEAEPAVGRTAEQMVATYQRRQYPDASMAYVIPRAQLGFNPGYGAVYDLTFVGDAGVPIQSRLVVMSAVKDDLAITLAGVGPLDTRVRAHPNPARTSTVICFSDVGNTITWPGDDPL